MTPVFLLVLASLARSDSRSARVGIAQGLGILGEHNDARAMRAALDPLAEPALQGIAATALAFHGSLDALTQLSELSKLETGGACDVRRRSRGSDSCSRAASRSRCRACRAA